MHQKEKFLDLNYQEKKFRGRIKNFKKKEKEKILRALAVAAKEHQGQIRDAGCPYIIHPIRAGLILLEETEIRDIDIISAILLHDVVEDGRATIRELQKQFGKEIARLVNGVTRKSSRNETKNQKIKNKLAKIQKIARSDKKVRLVKLCDRLDNRCSREFISQNHPSRKKFERWNKEFKKYLPIAEKTDKKLFEIFRSYEKQF